MKITVVVPVYNVEKYLRCCIESLLNQSKKAYEIILVDDGSIDSSGIICDEYTNREDNIRVIHKKNEGLGLTRNCGIREAQGDFITFVDADDFCDIDYLEKFEKIVLKNKCDTCKTSYKRVDINGKYLYGHDVCEGEFIGDEIRNELIPRFIGSSPKIKDSITMSSCDTLYSLKIIRDYQVEFPSEREWISEDLIFNIEYYSHAEKVNVSNYQGYNYRVTEGSLTQKYNPERFQRYIDLYNKEKEMLMNLDIYSISKYRLDRQFFVYTRVCFEQIRKSSLSKKEKSQEIQRICQNGFLQNIIKHYPIQELGIKQKVFLYLIRYKMIVVLARIYG